jgi:hypothetical protein
MSQFVDGVPIYFQLPFEVIVYQKDFLIWYSLDLLT